jgi:hypothetical protein
MRYALVASLFLVALLAACGDDGSSDLATELEDVCTQTDNADTDRIDVSSPEEGDEVTSPLTVSGEIDTIGQEFWISAVTAEGDHVISYPARSRDLEEGTMSPFEISVPFTVGEETPVCIWVYRENVQNVTDQDEAVRIPVRFLPSPTPGATSQ